MSLKDAKVLILNAGYNQPPMAKGKLNEALANDMEKYLQGKGHETKITHMEQGYKVEEEVAKFNWADVIIVQTPTWWLGLPGPAKTYIDSVLSAYMMNPDKKDGKKVSATFAATEETMVDPKSAYQGLGADQVWWTLYQNFFFCGIGKLPIVTVNNVLNPSFKFDEAVSKLHAHLDKVLV
ncbi:hypothetical protein TVAG_311630 [Trichomonas vaginalis G3]|uniref:Flavodoxin-like fold domain-containing protein n=1 Tax=Trichomonas vaginalis (strain ATCC PRA-98 / G3) TaxID=412133 RepID=A2EJX0_TRIV3|nr:flavodoxin-like fold [Trichomonas vaginalis G3]EAY07038.1 hypothetical protein TVAG_311630 [Trichomonas vaginalis G3]KAI5529566.1 flavodoxin-like fold [Trichomonas vaginalis G3]|eukprot:XP_001319261.1 hypothetical protein [Trichomonas vaginalis G3]